jgi:hypothetical protein
VSLDSKDWVLERVPAMADPVTRPTRHPWWLRAMYTVLLVAVLSLMLLFLQDVLVAVESEGGELHHLFVFDLAWPFFLIAGLASLIAGLASLIIGLLRADAGLTRYGAFAVAVVAGAVLLIVIAERLQAPEHP